MPKDQTRMVSQKGYAVAHSLKDSNNRHTAKLLKLQKYAWETKNLKLAEMITELFDEPMATNMTLELWQQGEIDALIAVIEAGENK